MLRTRNTFPCLYLRQVHVPEEVIYPRNGSLARNPSKPRRTRLSFGNAYPLRVFMLLALKDREHSVKLV